MENFEKEKVAFPVSKVPVMDIIGPGIKGVKQGITHAIIKEDTREILSFVSADYALVKNADILKSFREYFSGLGIATEVSCRAYRDVRFQMSFALTDYVEEIQKGDKVLPMFNILNSYNRSQRYQFSVSVWRKVCSNGLHVWVEENKIDMLHTPGLANGVAVEESLELIKSFLPAFEETLDPYYELADREYPNLEAVNQRIDEVAEAVKFPALLVEDAKEQAKIEMVTEGLSPSDWLAYNALNYQLNHNADNLLGRKANGLDKQVMNYLLNY